MKMIVVTLFPNTTSFSSPGERCILDRASRKECGWCGMTQVLCESKGCCWHPLAEGGPWCFHAGEFRPRGEGVGRTVVNMGEETRRVGLTAPLRGRRHVGGCGLGWGLLHSCGEGRDTRKDLGWRIGDCPHSTPVRTEPDPWMGVEGVG